MKFGPNNLLALFYKLPKNLALCFSGYNLAWQFLAMILTYVLAFSGFDWRYFQFFRQTFLYSYSFSAATIGSVLPIVVPVFLFIDGRIRKDSQRLNTAFALGQAAILASLISSFYKAITGRMYPPQFVQSGDISKVFRFGFFRGGIFWGWPSSHSTIAFAMAVALIMLYPKNKLIKYTALAYALFIGLGVSISIHWFSDFVAGTVMGIVIGVVVGKSFFDRRKALLGL